MSEYGAVYEQMFVDNLRRYSAMRQRIKQRIERIMENPSHNTELLADAMGSGVVEARGLTVIFA